MKLSKKYDNLGTQQIRGYYDKDTRDDKSTH